MIKRYGEDVLARAIEVFGEDKQRAQFAAAAGKALAAVMGDARNLRPGETVGYLADLIILTTQTAMATGKGPCVTDTLNLDALNRALDERLRDLQERTTAEEDRRMRETEAWERLMELVPHDEEE